jgi:dTMP kinase
MTRGRFITLEGIEGAGKSTLAARIASWLGTRGLRARLTREPGGTPLAEQVRRIVLERGSETVSPAAETLLMFAARGIHVDNLIVPALERGEWVICDRFTDATRAYQGYGRGMDLSWIERLAAAAHGSLQPDRTLLLDLPVPEGLARARDRRAGAADRFESEREEFFERVRAGYLSIARNEPDRLRIVDATRPPAVVEEQVRGFLEELVRGGPER